MLFTLSCLRRKEIGGKNIGSLDGGNKRTEAWGKQKYGGRPLTRDDHRPGGHGPAQGLRLVLGHGEDGSDPRFDS